MNALFCPYCYSVLPNQQTGCCGEVAHGVTQEELDAAEAALERRVDDEIAAYYERDNIGER